MNQSGNTLTNGNQYYYPYGGNRAQGDPGAFLDVTTKRFTGQYHESSLPGGEGLSYYNARWYDPQLGRFIQPDTIVPNPGDAQSFDRYAYVFNNPLKYTDPTGHCPICVVLVLAAVAIGVEGSVAESPAGSYVNVPDSDNGALMVSLISGDVNDIATLATGYDYVWQQEIPYFSDEWYDTAKWAAIPIVGAGTIRAINTLRRGGRIISGIDTIANNQVIRRVVNPLSDSLKSTLRKEGRAIFEGANPGRLDALGLDVHHRIPLEWAHLFPDADPNRLANLTGLDPKIHRQINNEWLRFKQTLGGRTPTAAEVQLFASELDNVYSQHYR